MNYNWKNPVRLLLCGTMLLCQQIWAAELENIEWESGASPETLSLQLDGAADHRVESLDNDRRLRIVLPGATLGEGISDISGRGLVKSVFPFVGDDGQSVNVDLLLEQPGRLEVTPTNLGLDVVARSGAAGGSEQGGGAPAEPGGANTLTGINYSTLPGGRVQVNLSMSQPPEQPGQFSTNNPPRLAFDFFNTRSQLDAPVTRVGVGAVESITTVQAEDRTRVVFNLVRPVPYDTQITDDGIVFVIQNPDTESARVERTEPKPFARKSAAKHSIENIDFRRGGEGGGRVIVQLSDPSVGVDVREQAGEIIIDFLNSEIDDDLEQRLDVVDFATPVQTIDTFQEGNTVRMVVTPRGNYQHLAYQSGNVFNINVDPVVQVEEDEETDEFGYSGDRLSLNFQQINVRAALQVIADFTGLNFVTSDSVTGTLTLRLKDVPWDQALDIILQTRGLGMRQSGNVVWVAPAEEIAQRERQQLESQQQQTELQPLTSELIQVNYAKASDIAAILKSVKAVDTGVQQSLFGSVNISEVETESNSLLSPRGNVTVDDRTNSILIQDTPGKISQVRELIAKLDKPVRQVLIETRIVEANDSFSRNLGARLGFQRVTQQAEIGGANIGDVTASGTLEGASSTSSSLGGSAGAPSFAGTPDGLSVNLPASGIGENAPNPASYAFEIFKAGTGIANLIQLEISALEAEGRGKVIASPRLITSNQQEARIEQGQERIFTTSVLGVGSVVTKKAVLSLTVTPQITPDDRVVMDVFVTQDSFESPTQPTINTKQISTQVLLENGETAVIGGIYQQEKSNSVTKVPLLGDIPGLGVLFRTKSRNDIRTELLIFLTPRIVNPALNLGSLDTPAVPAA
ncbi:MAG: type IV pilus secretin PilQ [Gammaproteobacteria bacterium]|nr:type IV pilus secretin PilQ [Gammaproteobacteria bacterium]